MQDELQSKIGQLLGINFNNAEKNQTIELINGIIEQSIQDKTTKADLNVFVEQKDRLQKTLNYLANPGKSVADDIKIIISKTKRAYLNVMKENATEIYEALKEVSGKNADGKLKIENFRELAEKDNAIGAFIKMIGHFIYQAFFDKAPNAGIDKAKTDLQKCKNERSAKSFVQKFYKEKKIEQQFDIKI